MWKALQKQLRQERRQGPAAACGSPHAQTAHSSAVQPLQPGNSHAPPGQPASAPLADVSCELVTRLEAVRGAQPRFHQRLLRLDAGQLAAVLSDDPAVLVRAPVGSGKTTVLVHRVLYLHLCQGVPLRNIVLVTFTNRAAAELRERIAQLLEQPLPSDALWLTGTFHSVACTLLRRVLPIAQQGLARDFSILDSEATHALLAELIKTHRLRVGRRQKLRQRLRTVEKDRHDAGDLGRLADLFARAKQERNALDFDDLIDFAAALLPSDPSPTTSASNIPDAADSFWPQAVLVDEMQDCEARDLAFLRALRGSSAHFFAVGDPYQAIYGFRGSAPQLFARAEVDFACRTYALPCNYRSTRQIVDGARAVLGMQPASGGTVGALHAVRGLGDRIVVRRHHDPVAEAIYLAERVVRLIEAGIPAGEIAVLFRLRAQASLVRETFEARGLACIEHDESPALDDSDDGDVHCRLSSSRAAAGTPVADAVRLLTLHAAKGLEWRVVFLSGINQGLLPLGRGLQLDVAHDAEERRLLFVGITRAKDCVEISYHSRPHERFAVGEPSDFLAALPADLVDWARAEDDAAAQVVSARAGSQEAAGTALPTAELAPAASPLSGPLPLPPDRSRSPGAETAPAGSEDASQAWQPGQAVRHPRYGVGVIVARQGGTLDCSFGKLGARSFPVALCPLSRIP